MADPDVKGEPIGAPGCRGYPRPRRVDCCADAGLTVVGSAAPNMGVKRVGILMKPPTVKAKRATVNKAPVCISTQASSLRFALSPSNYQKIVPPLHTFRPFFLSTMSASTPLPSDDQIKAFFADDSSFGRFVEFSRHLLTCAIYNS